MALPRPIESEVRSIASGLPRGASASASSSRLGLSDADSAFVSVYRSQQNDLVRLAYLMCGSRAAAEDAVADAVASVLPRWRRGGLDNPEAYLRRAVVNTMLNGFRRQKRAQDYVDRQRKGDDGSPAPDEDIARQAIIVHALMELPKKQRAVLVLRYFEDLPEAEVASALGTSIGTVKSRVARGLERLRSLLEDSDVAL